MNRSRNRLGIDKNEKRYNSLGEHEKSQDKKDLPFYEEDENQPSPDIY